jgi:hypothetical protein
MFVSACKQLTHFMENSPSQKMTVIQLVKKLSAFHGTRKFITVLTRARHQSRYINPVHTLFP